MVPEKSLELIGRWVRAFNQRDMDALFEATATDFEFTPYLANLLETTTYRGHNGLRKYFADADSAWAGIQIRLKDLRAAPDDRIFAAGELQARGRASGADVRVTVAWAGIVRGEKLAWVSTYESEDDALEAAGLSE